MASGVAFFLGNQVVGAFPGARPPTSDGTYPYEPYRGPGHLNLCVQLEASHAPRCHYVFEDKRIEFSVLSRDQYGTLRLVGFEVSD